MKSNYKDIGTCLRNEKDEVIYRSKFKTQVDAQDAFDILKNLGVVNKSFIVYKCAKCNTWHFGDKKWSLYK